MAVRASKTIHVPVLMTAKRRRRHLAAGRHRPHWWPHVSTGAPGAFMEAVRLRGAEPTPTGG